MLLLGSVAEDYRVQDGAVVHSVRQQSNVLSGSTVRMQWDRAVHTTDAADVSADCGKFVRDVDGRMGVQAVERTAPAQMNGIKAVRPSARSCAIFADTDMVCSAAARIVTADRCLIEGRRLPCAHPLRRTLQRRPIAKQHVHATRNGRKQRRTRKRKGRILQYPAA